MLHIGKLNFTLPHKALIRSSFSLRSFVCARNESGREEGETVLYNVTHILSKKREKDPIEILYQQDDKDRAYDSLAHISVRFINIVIGGHRNPCVTRRSHTFFPPRSGVGNSSLSLLPSFSKRRRAPPPPVCICRAHPLLYIARVPLSFLSFCTLRPVVPLFRGEPPHSLFFRRSAAFSSPSCFSLSASTRSLVPFFFAPWKSFVPTADVRTIRRTTIERKRGRKRYFSRTRHRHWRQR